MVIVHMTGRLDSSCRMKNVNGRRRRIVTLNLYVSKSLGKTNAGNNKRHAELLCHQVVHET